MYFLQIAQLQEQLKSYYIARTYDTEFANELLREINAKRLEIALDAELREIFYAQQDIPIDASGYQQSHWFTKNDTEYAIKRAVAELVTTATISAVNQGNYQRILTREPMRWQNLFSNVQDLNNSGQQIPFDFPQEMRFAENESLGVAIQGQTDLGYIFYHGCTFKDHLEDAARQALQNEIAQYTPAPQYVPMIFTFADSEAVDPSGSNQIFSAKNDRSVILTHVSTSSQYFRLTITDEGRNQLICEDLEVGGMAGYGENAYTVYYPLPYPHLLRRGDRLRLRATNGSPMYDTSTDTDTLQYLTFKGFSI